MKFKSYIILQAIGKKLQGPKAGYSKLGGFQTIIYPTKEQAENYLKGVKANVIHEQSIGVRSKDNLNPEIGLDWAVTECLVSFDAEKVMKEKGWVLDNTITDEEMATKIMNNLLNDKNATRDSVR